MTDQNFNHDTNDNVTGDAHNEVTGPQENPRAQGEKLAEDFKRVATEAGYAAAGFAGFVGERAKEFYDEQRRQYAQTHPDTDKDPGAKEFMLQLREKLNEFVEGLTKGFNDMAERGRARHDGEDSDNSETDVTDADADPANGPIAEDPQAQHGM